MTWQDSILRIVFLILGTILAFVDMFWVASLSYQGQLAENSVAILILTIIAIGCFLIAKEME